MVETSSYRFGSMALMLLLTMAKNQAASGCAAIGNASANTMPPRCVPSSLSGYTRLFLYFNQIDHRAQFHVAVWRQQQPIQR